MTLNDLLGKKAVVTWSGGLDSTTLLFFMIEECKIEAFPIFINRQQENYQAEAGSVRYFSGLLSKKYPTKFHDTLEVTTIIPPLEFKNWFPETKAEKIHALRNSDIVNQAVRYALIKEIDIILVGSNINDRFGDNSIVYWKAKSEEIRQGSNNDRLRVIAPFQELRWDKDSMVIWCKNHQIPIHKSWSCWRTYENHCGICSPCGRRKDAFEKAKIKDLTEYLE